MQLLTAQESINTLMVMLHSIPQTVCFESCSATSTYEKASLFNSYFHSVFTQSSFPLPPVDKLLSPEVTLSDIVISESDVYSALNSLDPSKAMGIDGIGLCH